MRNSLMRLSVAVLLVLLLSVAAFAQRGQRGDPRRGVQTSAPSVPHDPHDLTGIWRGNAQSLTKDPDPKWLGETAVGKWDGDTFVVDAVGFDERAWIDHFGNPHSEDMHLTERFHRLDRDTLEIVLTIDDPKTYTKQWVSDKLIFHLQPKEKIHEDFCVPSEEESFNQGVR